MKNTITLRILLLAVFFCIITSCGNEKTGLNGEANPIAPITAKLEGLHGCACDGVSSSIAEDTLKVSFTKIPATGQYVRIKLPAGKSVGSASWQGNRLNGIVPLALTIAVYSQGGLDLGIMPLAAYSGTLISLSAPLAATPRIKKAGQHYSGTMLRNLSALPGELGQVEISWIQDIPGDYNFDGTVDVLDIQAMAALYGQAVDRDGPNAQETPGYWVDGAGDGTIDEQDIAIISEHYGCAVTGYNVRREGEIKPGQSGSSPTIKPDQVDSRLGLPPLYSVLLDGTTENQFSVAPVLPAGLEGATVELPPYKADLVVKVNIDGIDLANLLDQWASGASVAKHGTRVIDPTEIVGRPTNAKPVVVSGKTAVYSGITKKKSLLLDIRYLPLLDLATGAARTVSEVPPASPKIIDNPEGLQWTAIPFMIMDGAGILEINANINVTPNPVGGYYIDLSTTQAIAGQYSKQTKLRLSYVDGKLTGDSNSNGDYSGEAQFQDDDRDQVSNQRIEQEQQYPENPDLEIGNLVLDADLEQLSLFDGSLSLSSTVIKSGDPTDFDPSQSFMINESTFFGFPFDPYAWQRGDRLTLEMTKYINITLREETYYKVDKLYLIHSAGNDPPQSYFIASSGISGRIDLSWGAVENCTGYAIERYEIMPGGYVLDNVWYIDNAETLSFSDSTVFPDVEYRYILYGFQKQVYIYLMEAYGSAATDPDNPVLLVDFTGRLLDSPASGKFTIVNSEGNAVAFTWDADTQWWIDYQIMTTPQDFVADDVVLVQAEALGDTHLAHFIVELTNTPPSDPGGRP